MILYHDQGNNILKLFINYNCLSKKLFAMEDRSTKYFLFVLSFLIVNTLYIYVINHGRQLKLIGQTVTRNKILI
jgi:hypothetical protein